VNAAFGRSERVAAGRAGCSAARAGFALT
jgi:hypothetical protein